MKKEIVIISDSKLNQANYTALEYSYLRAFKQRGFACDLATFDVNPYLYQVLTKVSPNLLYRYLRYKQKPILNFLSKNNKKFVFVIKGYYLLPETIEELKTWGKIVFCFYPDDPYRILPGTSTQFVEQSIKSYNLYFIWSKVLLQKIGGDKAFYLPFAADTDLLKPSQLSRHSNSSIIDCDVSFIGNADKERESFLKSLGLILKDDHVKIIYGSWWKSIENFMVKGKVNNEDLINAIYHSKINLNILRVQNKNSNNMRTFEIPAVAGFMLHEYSDEVRDYFKPGIEADYFKDSEECADKISFYLKNESLRQKIAEAGHRKLFSAGHLYTNRVDEIWQKVLS